MSTKYISYIAIVSVVFILLTQSYLVFDYFQTVRYALIRESDAILKDAFRSDLNQRNRSYLKFIQEDSINSSEKADADNVDKVMDFDMRDAKLDDSSVLNKFDLST